MEISITVSVSRGVRISFSWGGGGCSFKIRPTHRSIDDTLIQPKFVGRLSRANKSKILRRSTVKIASINFKQFIFETVPPPPPPTPPQHLRPCLYQI